MKFEDLRERVRRREQLLDRRIARTGERAAALKSTWRESWTPSRIVIAGIAAGFLFARMRPGRTLRRFGGVGGARWLQLFGTFSSLYASLQSTFAAAVADAAAGEADDAADAARGAATEARGDGAPDGCAGADAEPKPRSDRRRPDPTWTSPPTPAEAATDVSER